MAITKDTVINAATVAAGSNTSTPVSQAVTKQLCVWEVKITNGSTAQKQGSRLLLNYGVTSQTLTDTSVRAQLPSCRSVECELSGLAASGVKIFKSKPFIADGDVVWAWTDGIALDGSVTVTAILSELV